jgi:hypothetical protein
MLLALCLVPPLLIVMLWPDVQALAITSTHPSWRSGATATIRRLVARLSRDLYPVPNAEIVCLDEDRRSTFYKLLAAAICRSSTVPICSPLTARVD